MFGKENLKLKTRPRIYLDFNATTPVRPEVVHAMEPYWSQFFGNPSSVHLFGQEAKAALEKARITIARFLRARKPDEIVFTSSGSEANALAIRGVLAPESTRDSHILASPIEHDSVAALLNQLREEGAQVEFLGVDKQGCVDPDDLRRKIKHTTRLVIVMQANNEIGTIEPIEEIASITRERGIFFHVDSVQSVGKIPVDAGALGADTLSLSGHKIGAPKGIAALYIREGVRIRPLVPGHHELGRRSGTQNVAYAVGLARACEIAQLEMPLWAREVRPLRDDFEKRVLGLSDGVQLNGHPLKRVPNTSCLSFRGLSGQNLLIALDMEGIAVSAGASCASGTTRPSPTLEAIGVGKDYIQGALRFSLGKTTTKEELDTTFDILTKILARERSLVS